MKKCVIGILLVSLLLFPYNGVKAETLNEYVAKAEAALKSERAKIAEKEMTEKERNEALAQKEQITKDITSAEEEVVRLEDEIKKLQESIKKKDQEIKSLMKFIQISNGESAYLEYAFGASDFTDFIYRLSVVEQLSDYNKTLITEYNKAIKDSEQKQKDLAVKQEELKKKREELSVLIDKLASQISGLSDSIQSYKSEYEALMSYVSSLKSMGCGGNEDVNACISRNNNTPSVNTGGAFSGFLMPLDKGRITQDYYGKKHNALDISNYEGAPVYPPVAGSVLKVWRPSDGCGHIVVFIKHNVNGKNYTTVYYHSKTVSVSERQVVTANTQIGTQGGNPSYDRCTTGSHLDFKLFRGVYGSDFYSLTNGPHISPRTWLTQAPREGGRFGGRS